MSSVRRDRSGAAMYNDCRRIANGELEEYTLFLERARDSEFWAEKAKRAGHVIADRPEDSGGTSPG